jgi:hypothetical protein
LPSNQSRGLRIYHTSGDGPENIALSGAVFRWRGPRETISGATKPHSASDEELLKPALDIQAATGSDEPIGSKRPK